MNQSNYIPWKGYFDLIHDADLFVFYDDVQFTKNDWRNRNRIKSPAGMQWLTVPVGTDLNRLIGDVAIPERRWQSRHWKTLRQCYGTAPFFKQYQTFLDHVYLEREWHNLSELNQFLIQTVAAEFLGIKTTFARSSDFVCAGAKQDRLLSLLRGVQADVYISGPAAKAYLEPARFTAAGIELTWKDYVGYPEYPQLFPPFEHAVTILDVLFHVGSRASSYIWGWRQDTGAGGSRQG